MDSLWAPWRIDYIKSEKEKGCIFCDKPAEGDDRSMLILHRGENSFVIMNLYPFNNGHLMIAPYQHTDSTHKLNSSSRSEIMELADQAMTIQKNIMNADGFNYGANIGHSGGAGIADHIHFHIVPRWTGDTNFMPVLGHTKVQMQGLQETYNALRPHFDKLK